MRYRIEPYGFDEPRAFEQCLNQWADDGWEVVAVFGSGGNLNQPQFLLCNRSQPHQKQEPVFDRALSDG